ncbi:type IV pilin protein [Polyangium fumosum]|nr:prepilin-type N-terminal cleavage/methylation domain-containing protein [Polyangium fumosum]
MVTMQFGERPRSYAKRRGFTLAELMIVVAMIGVLAALAMVGYRRYIRGAAASEVKAVVSGIRIAEEAYKAETFQYLGCTEGFTEWYPDKPNDKKRNWDNGKVGNPVHDCFMQLNVTTDGPVRFGYAVVAGIAPQTGVTNVAYCQGWETAHATVNGPWFVVQAAGNQDNDNDFSLFASSSLTGELCIDPANGDDE